MKLEHKTNMGEYNPPIRHCVFTQSLPSTQVLQPQPRHTHKDRQKQVKQTDRWQDKGALQKFTNSTKTNFYHFVQVGGWWLVRLTDKTIIPWATLQANHQKWGNAGLMPKVGRLIVQGNIWIQWEFFKLGCIYHNFPCIMHGKLW